MEELIGVLSDNLGDLGVASRNLLQDGLQHVGLLLHKLTELLEVRVVAEEVQVGKVGTTCARSSTGTGTTTSTATLAGLGSSLKQVDRLLATRASSGSSWSRRSRRSGALLTLLLLLLLFLLNIIGDTL